MFGRRCHDSVKTVSVGVDGFLERLRAIPTYRQERYSDAYSRLTGVSTRSRQSARETPRHLTETSIHSHATRAYVILYSLCCVIRLISGPIFLSVSITIDSLALPELSVFTTTLFFFCSLNSSPRISSIDMPIPDKTNAKTGEASNSRADGAIITAPIATIPQFVLSKSVLYSFSVPASTDSICCSPISRKCPSPLDAIKRLFVSTNAASFFASSSTILPIHSTFISSLSVNSCFVYSFRVLSPIATAIHPSILNLLAAIQSMYPVVIQDGHVRTDGARECAR